MLVPLLEKVVVVMKASFLYKHKVQGQVVFSAQTKHYSHSQLRAVAIWGKCVPVLPAPTLCKSGTAI